MSSTICWPNGLIVISDIQLDLTLLNLSCWVITTVVVPLSACLSMIFLSRDSSLSARRLLCHKLSFGLWSSTSASSKLTSSRKVSKATEGWTDGTLFDLTWKGWGSFLSPRYMYCRPTFSLHDLYIFTLWDLLFWNEHYDFLTACRAVLPLDRPLLFLRGTADATSCSTVNVSVLFSLDQQLERCHRQCKQMSRKWMQMELTQSARWLITFYRSNTRLMTGVTKPVSHYGYHYYYLLFLRVSIEYRGIIYLRVWVCTMPWFLLPKAFHKIDCIGLQKYSLLQQTCRKYSLTFCDRQWWQKLPCG